jgi:hypothetical protein
VSDVLIYGAPEASPDMFHAIPAGIGDPFLYAERGDRRVATASVLDADKVTALGIEVYRRASLGGDPLLARAWRGRVPCSRITLRACGSGIDARDRAAQFRSAVPTSCARAGSRSTSTPRRSPRAAGARTTGPSSRGSAAQKSRGRRDGGSARG